MKVTIDVTQEDIDLGERGGLMTCPIYRAWKRICSNLQCVGRFYAELKNENGNLDVDLPMDVQNFINDFDNEKNVSPFSFELDLPE